MAVVDTASSAFGSLFSWAFEAQILAVWGPPFVILLFINLARVALGRGYAPGTDAAETQGWRVIRDELCDRRSE